jgi:hypothetical protein
VIAVLKIQHALANATTPTDNGGNIRGANNQGAGEW